MFARDRRGRKNTVFIPLKIAVAEAKGQKDIGRTEVPFEMKAKVSECSGGLAEAVKKTEFDDRGREQIDGVDTVPITEERGRVAVRELVESGHDGIKPRFATGQARI